MMYDVSVVINMTDVLIDLDSEGMLNEIQKTSKDIAVFDKKLRDLQ